MTRAAELKLIADHLESALFLADGLPTTPGQLCLRDALIGALQELCVLYPLAEKRERAQKGRAS